MDIYKLNSNFERIDVIENYTSFAWTERWIAAGECQLIVDPNSSWATDLVEEDLLGIPGSDKVMYIETVNEKDDSVTFLGCSLENWWKRRVSDTPYGPLGESDELWEGWNPGEIVVQTLGPFEYDASDPETLPITSMVNDVTAAVIDAEYMPAGEVYDWLQTFCSAYNMGCSMVPASPGTPYLTFRVFTGTDRTSAGPNPLVAFSKSLSNLVNTERVRSNANWKNIAYVSGQKDTLLVAAEGTSLSVTGADRRVLAVDATDITTGAGGTLNKKLKARGLTSLVDYKKSNVFNGETPAGIEQKYRTDYFLGDIVELWDSKGVKSRARVTEHIWTSDESGERAYPTLERVP